MTSAECSGRLIAVCGTDGTGKSTQTELLVDRLASAGRTVRSISFPRYGQGFFGDLIERYLRGEFARKAGDVSPYLAALPYACDRWEVSEKLRRWVDGGHVVICNRYVPANQAHQGAKLPSERERAEFFDWVDRLEFGVFGLPRPDLNLLLDLPTEISARLISGRTVRADAAPEQDIHEQDADYLAATAAAYRALAAARPAEWTVIACSEGGAVLPREAIAERVWDAVLRIL